MAYTPADAPDSVDVTHFPEDDDPEFLAGEYVPDNYDDAYKD